MNAQEFCFWLQGYLEISNAKTLGEQEMKIVKDHLALVFEKKTPQYWNPHQQQLLLDQAGASGMGYRNSSELIVDPNNPPAFICNLEVPATC